MITTSRQNWSINSTVRVGFLRLRVIAVIPTPANFRPDEYALESLDGGKFYRFTPHHGVVRVESRAAAVEPTF